MKSEARKKLEAKHAAEVQQLAAKHMAEAKAIIDEYERLHPGCFDEEAPEADEELALRAGQAGKAAFLAALAEGKSRLEANEIAIAVAQAVLDAEGAEF